MDKQKGYLIDALVRQGCAQFCDVSLCSYSDMDKQKGYLIDALVRQGCAQFSDVSLCSYSDMDKQKGYLIDALVRQGCAQADVILEKLKTEPAAEFDATHVNKTWEEIQKWADVADSKVRTCQDSKLCFIS